MCAMQAHLGSVFMQVVGMRSKKPQGKGKSLLDSGLVFFQLHDNIHVAREGKNILNLNIKGLHFSDHN